MMGWSVRVYGSGLWSMDLREPFVLDYLRYIFQLLLFLLLVRHIC